MKKLYVFADFDWQKEPRLIGELNYESLRGSDSYGFCYNDEWLKDYGGLFLSDDLNKTTILVSNTRLPARIFSDVFLMPFQTGGDVH